MSEREDYEGLADQLGDETDRLEQESERLEQKIGDVRVEWERKRADQRVPGAAPPDDDEQGSEQPGGSSEETEGA